MRIQIEGHCDERGTAEYNLALGAKRAQTARDYLVTLGISADRLSTISYGAGDPGVHRAYGRLLGAKSSCSFRRRLRSTHVMTKRLF